MHFPWGSLLRGLLDAHPAILGPLAATLRHEGELRVLVSASERDGYPELTPERLARLAPAYRSSGLALVESRTATPRDIALARSSWAKRLAAGRARSVVLARYRRAAVR